MIEVRVFATLRQGRDKVTLLSPEGIACAGDILDRMNIPQEEVSILLINGFHHNPESEVKDGDIVEQGNHETLLKKHGFYYDLYTSQFAGIGGAENPAV